MKRHGVFPAVFSFIGLCKSTNGKFVAPFSNIKPKHLIRLWPDQTQTPLRCKGPCQLRVCHWLRRCKQKTDCQEMYYNLYKYSRFYHNQTDNPFINGKILRFWPPKGSQGSYRFSRHINIINGNLAIDLKVIRVRQAHKKTRKQLMS